MKVRGKFRMISEKKHAYNQGQKTVEFQAVYGTQGENADYAKATPQGRIEMTIDASTPAFDAFVLGREYYVDFEPVDTAG